LHLKNRQQSAFRQKHLKLFLIVDDDVIYRLCEFQVKVNIGNLLNDIHINMETYAGNAVVSKIQNDRFASILLFTVNSKKSSW
jgi:hypothetical protein